MNTRPVPWSALLVAVALTCSAATFMLVSLTGCPAFISALPTVVEVVNDAGLLLSMISQGVNAYFRANPNVAEQTKIENAITKAQTTLIAGEQTLVGVQNATAGQMTAAFSAFTNAYADLMVLVAPLGIVPAQPVAAAVVIADAGPADGGVKVAAPPRLVVPTPLILRITASRSAR